MAVGGWRLVAITRWPGNLTLIPAPWRVAAIKSQQPKQHRHQTGQHKCSLLVEVGVEVALRVGVAKSAKAKVQSDPIRLEDWTT